MTVGEAQVNQVDDVLLVVKNGLCFDKLSMSPNLTKNTFRILELKAEQEINLVGRTKEE